MIEQSKSTKPFDAIIRAALILIISRHIRQPLALNKYLILNSMMISIAFIE